MRKVLLLFFLFVRCAVGFSQSADFTNGIFILNEDQFGTNNSTLNFLKDDGSFEYYIYQKANIGKSLGCTAQFATIYADKLFVV
ncbi:MAG: DUF5074 domain-containing protein, partial [Dysgonomonas sp.]